VAYVAGRWCVYMWVLTTLACVHGSAKSHTYTRTRTCICTRPFSPTITNLVSISFFASSPAMCRYGAGRGDREIRLSVRSSSGHRIITFHRPPRTAALATALLTPPHSPRSLVMHTTRCFFTCEQTQCHFLSLTHTHACGLLTASRSVWVWCGALGYPQQQQVFIGSTPNGRRHERISVGIALRTYLA